MGYHVLGVGYLFLGSDNEAQEDRVYLLAAQEVHFEGQFFYI